MTVHGPRNSSTCKYSFLFLDLWHLDLLSAVACLSQVLEIRLIPPRVLSFP
ncbi:hypothetical protein RchiOBHm_Chr2g0151841 [Rosa chinensis]|uniref:Uncharacterized protein n=1 Tax=Rosa chinensis TaxID=74649 RepID=A0A2P6S0A6_ROSCH|nr:hypothetical protein RchiOBHm_Chr2g0151841 [Rosa chinensis]